MAILNNLERKGEQVLGKIPYNVIKTYALLSNPAVLGVYAGAKILPVVGKSLVSKKMLNIYKKVGISTVKAFGKAMGGTIKYTALGLGTTAYISAKGINKGYKYLKNKFFNKNKDIDNKWIEQNLKGIDLVSEIEAATKDISFENNEKEIETETIETTFANANPDLVNFIKNTPEYTMISERIDEKMNSLYTNEELHAIFNINKQAYADILLKAFNDLENNNAEFSDMVSKLRVEVQAEKENFELEKNPKAPEEEKEEEKEQEEEKNQEHELDDNTDSTEDNNNNQSTSNDMDYDLEIENNSLNQPLMEDNIELENNIELESDSINIENQETYHEINNVMQESVNLDEVENFMSFENVQRMSDLEEMQNEYRQLEFNLPDLDNDYQIPGQMTFDNTEKAPINTREFTSTITLEEVERNIDNGEKTVSNELNETIDNKEIQYTDYDNYNIENSLENNQVREEIKNESKEEIKENSKEESKEESKEKNKEEKKEEKKKEDFDEIYISGNTRVIFRITENGKIYQSFDFAGKYSKERLITDEEYVRFKKDSLKVSKNQEIQMQMKKQKQLEDTGFER